MFLKEEVELQQRCERQSMKIISTSLFIHVKSYIQKKKKKKKNRKKILH